MEIERKFLVDDPPDLADAEGSEVEQGYLALATDEGGAEVRLRRRRDEITLTVKSAGDRAREEEEVELSDDDFERLWALTEGRRLTKRRYVIPRGALEIEVDVYSGELEGLVVAEVEFDDEAAADDFHPPGWFGKEVTGKEEYRNESLATKGAPD